MVHPFLYAVVTSFPTTIFPDFQHNRFPTSPLRTLRLITLAMLLHDLTLNPLLGEGLLDCQIHYFIFGFQCFFYRIITQISIFLVIFATIRTLKIFYYG